MPKRTLSEGEKQSIVTQQTQQAIAQYPGSFRKVVVADQTGDDGAPVVTVVLAGQPESYVSGLSGPRAA